MINNSRNTKSSTALVKFLIILSSLSGRQKQLISVVALVVIAVISSFLYPYAKSVISKKDDHGIGIINSKSNEITKASNLYIYVCGEVKNPGVYEVEDGSRIADAIVIAGGISENANLKAINLAQKLCDGMMIIVPDKNFPDMVNSPIASNQSNKIINLNLATSEQLQELPGIGPSLAERIIRYRTEHGKFTSVEGLLNVSGIGEKKLNDLRELVEI